MPRGPGAPQQAPPYPSPRRTAPAGEMRDVRAPVIAALRSRRPHRGIRSFYRPLGVVYSVPIRRPPDNPCLGARRASGILAGRSKPGSTWIPHHHRVTRPRHPDSTSVRRARKKESGTANQFLPRCGSGAPGLGGWFFPVRGGGRRGLVRCGAGGADEQPIS